MASHHHCHHHYGVSPPPIITSTCCSSSHCCSQSHHPSPQSLSAPPLDPLLQVLASQLLQQHQHLVQQSSHQTHLYTPSANTHQTQQSYHPKQLFREKAHSFRGQGQQKETPFVVYSLLQRIEALESSLNSFPTSMDNRYPSCSLRDVAARVIQTHFRAFLVRRSRTLRQLKDLAFIKSSFSSLKSSVSNKSHFDFEAISQKATDLLLKLDSIQGGDPMIRDGKRSISKDLVRFLDFIDGFAVKRHEILFKAAKNVRFVGKPSKLKASGTSYEDFGGDGREVMEKLRGRIEKINGFSRGPRNEDEEDTELEGFHQVIDDDEEEEENPRISINKKGNGVLVRGHGGQPKMKRRVSFAENDDVYVVFANTSRGHGNSSDGSLSSDDHEGLAENHSSEVEENKGVLEETDYEQADLGGSPQSSDGERRRPRDLDTFVRSRINGEFQVGNGSLAFSAPVPLKMEPRTNLLKKKAEKIVK